MKFSPIALVLAIGATLTTDNFFGPGGFLVGAEEASSVGTDAGLEVNAMFTPEEQNAMAEASEKFEFQAEVTRLMDIVINSLYKNKEIFLRELISNASDALDKARFKGLKEGDYLDSKKELEVRISFDKDARTLTIADSGIGMSKTELVENLGTVAKSGTTNFMEQLGGDGDADLSMIGQFGVGFYSIYLVSDKVTVASKSNDDDTQHVWSSQADGSFVVAPDPRGNTLGRGTEITMYLKDDASEYLDDYKIEGLVKRYSEFITFPIYLRKTVAETLAADEDEDEYDDGEEEDLDDEEEENDDDDEEEEEVEGFERDKRKTPSDSKIPDTYNPDPDSPHDPTIKKEVLKFEWVRANDNVAIWAREKDDVTDEEYKEFYTNLAKDGTDSNSWIHFKAEGEVEFKGILYIPEEAPHDMYDKYYEKDAKIRLYVRKVLITDDFEHELVPQYLNFLRGVVDSDDLPLNVNREGLQQSKVLKVMGKKLVRKALEMIRKLANSDADWKADEEDKDHKGDVKKSPYLRFWDQFGKSIKLGVIEDSSNRSKLTKLLRYKTSKTGEDGWRSLEEYVADMKEWQTNIYYIAGESMEQLESSPFLEKLKSKGLEVLYLSDPIDEYAMQQISEFDGKRMMSVTKEGLKFGDEDEDLVAAREKAYKAKFLPLTTYLKDVYGTKINKIVVSTRVETSPVVIVTGQWGNSANMERIMRAQAFSNNNKNSYLTSQKTMELNPRHPLITKLLAMVEDDPDAQETSDAAMMLYDTAALTSGFTIEDVEAYTARMFRIMKGVVGVDSFDLEEEIEIIEEDEDDFDNDEDDDEDDEDLDGHPEL